MTREDYRKALTSIAVGAITAFLTALFTGLAALLNGHGTELMAGTVAFITHHIRTS